MKSLILVFNSHKNIGRLCGLPRTFIPCIVKRINISMDSTPEINLNGLLFGMEIPFEEIKMECEVKESE